MPERVEQYRLNADKCLELAETFKDPDAKRTMWRHGTIILHRLRGEVPTRRSAANNCAGATSSSSRAASMNIGALTVPRSIRSPSATKLPVAISLRLNTFSTISVK
jgi:hypothetical protein